ncbi:MAG: HNH endonuclease [Actinomycetota bacterium]|nr:HNH endonuclease [Actinomycetota bacterium]
MVIGGDSTQRKLTGFLADLIPARDRYRCSELYCDAPIREIDHIRRAEDGGPTEFDNGRGLCTFHNQLREQPGWRVERTPDRTATTTPTGHTYQNPMNPMNPSDPEQ